MAKHKTKQYRRNQRVLHIEKRKRIIRDRWYDDFGEINPLEWNEDHVMPVVGKLSKGNVHDCMKFVDPYDSFHEFTIPDQKRAASMLDDMKECELAGIDGALKSKLSKTVRNSWRYKNNGHTLYRKGKFSHEEFQLLLLESDEDERWFQFLMNYIGCDSETAYMLRSCSEQSRNRILRLSA